MCEYDKTHDIALEAAIMSITIAVVSQAFSSSLGNSSSDNSLYTKTAKTSAYSTATAPASVAVNTPL